MWFQWFSFYGLWAFTMAFWVQFAINMNHDDIVCYAHDAVPSAGAHSYTHRVAGVIVILCYYHDMCADNGKYYQGR